MWSWRVSWENYEAVEQIVRHMAASDVGYGGINYPLMNAVTAAIVGLCMTVSRRGTNVRRIRRITGYLSTEERFNSAKQAELRDRKPHLH